MAKNFIDYTGMTYDDIKESIITRISQDSRFETFRESAMYSVITEIFAATTDFTNYYLERRAEESYMDSAQLRSSIILLSKMLGYVIRRPLPATANIKIVMKTIPANSVVGTRIEIPKYTTFVYEGQTMLLKDGLTYTLTQTDINNFADPTFFKEFKYFYTDATTYGTLVEDELINGNVSPIMLLQAEQRTYTVNATNNDQINKRFQTYKIKDKEFSNIFGDEDYGYNYNSSDPFSVVDNMTRVGVGTSESNAFCISNSEFNDGVKDEYLIDRRSFLNENSIPMLSAYNSGQYTNFCVIRTTMDDGVEVMFGDDNISMLGAKSGQNVYVRYLATKGSAGNKTGVIGKTVECQTNSLGTLFTRRNVQFLLNSNITGGGDIENIDSIKINSPEIFYSLERCVTPRDYINFLKTLVLSTKTAKNAIAWGEQEETKENEDLANIKLFNVVLFCVLSDLYVKNTDATYGQIYTDADYSDDPFLAPLSATQFGWYNTIVKSDSVTPLKNITSEADAYPDLKRVYDKLYTRSQLTVKNVYIAPIVQDFEITGNVYLNPLVNKLDVYKRITNEIYSHLSNNADFNIPVYKSEIIDIIQNYSEVDHADITITPVKLIDTDATKTFYVQVSGAEVPSYAPTFASDPIGKVYYSSITGKDMIGTREYSTIPLKTSNEIVHYCITSDASIWSHISAYNPSTLDSIFCLFPTLSVKSYKSDANFITSELVWPVNNSYDTQYCGTPVGTDTTNVRYDYTPSSRNLFLGIMQCYLNSLTTIANSDDTINSVQNGVMKMYDEYLNNKGTCFCSLKYKTLNDKNLTTTKSCSDSINNAVPSEINDFIDNYLELVVAMLHNSFADVIRENLLDSYGNVVKYSMKNEIVRLRAPQLTQFVYK